MHARPHRFSPTAQAGENRGRKRPLPKSAHRAGGVARRQQRLAVNRALRRRTRAHEPVHATRAKTSALIPRQPQNPTAAINAKSPPAKQVGLKIHAVVKIANAQAWRQKHPAAARCDCPPAQAAVSSAEGLVTVRAPLQAALRLKPLRLLHLAISSKKIIRGGAQTQQQAGVHEPDAP